MPKILLSLRPTLFATFGVLSLSACAQPPADAGPVAWRVQITTVADWPRVNELAEQVARVAQLPVPVDVAAFAPRAFAMTLQCVDARHCEQAVARLSAAGTLLSSVQHDQSRQIPSPPTRATAP
jgi:hypothetical protein